MKNDDAELLWLDEQHEVTASELLELSGLSAEELEWLVEAGAIKPIRRVPAAVTQQSNAWCFSGQCLIAVRMVSRLKRDFDLAPDALSLTLVLLERIRMLEQQLQQKNSQA
ncbi:MAG TPA: chaperone modulator CbpM [Methylotenera sp.]|jgi:chaperone modulatory protein CbpM|nr:chaperone modulator CbpM [Methylotenera sp.]HPV31635.1 chaperone modulator CbpM [Methylotenera sp.]